MSKSRNYAKTWVDFRRTEEYNGPVSICHTPGKGRSAARRQEHKRDRQASKAQIQEQLISITTENMEDENEVLAKDIEDFFDELMAAEIDAMYNDDYWIDSDCSYESDDFYEPSSDYY